ncbi:MAG: glycosyltransferase family 39 protein [Candidatus Omnitrophica bacterium]|nr:glycosyltransferase family 39 protein [Candidatus Omnitrophota bacterium]
MRKDQKFLQFLPCILLGLTLVASVLWRIRLLNVPLERDEGDYAYMAQLLLSGIPPYQEAYNLRFPGIFVAYALIMKCFGQTTFGIHLGLLFINALTTLAIFFLAKKLYDAKAAAFAALTFSLCSLGPWIQGIFANTEHFAILPVVTGLWILLEAATSGRLLFFALSGILLGIAVLMKQHAGLFFLFAFLYTLWDSHQKQTPFWKNTFAKLTGLVIGFVLPLAITFFLLWKAGVFQKFWFWSFIYARIYVSSLPLFWGFLNFLVNGLKVMSPGFFFWILGAIGLFFGNFFLLGFFLFSFLVTAIGLYFRLHYFMFLLPAVSLAAGAAFYGLQKYSWHKSGVGKILLFSLILAAPIHFLIGQRHYLFTMHPEEIVRMIYGKNPLAESVVIAKYLEEHTRPGERIAILGSEPQIYFYSRRRSATAYTMTYGLAEIHPFALNMQHEMIRQMESAKPSYIVFVNVPRSWLLRPESKMPIFNWFKKYSARFYRPVGFVEITEKGTRYFWDQEVSDRKPEGEAWMMIYKRVSGR